MIVRLRLFGAEVLYLGIGDGDAEEQGREAVREVDTGAADLTIAEPQPLGFGLPHTEHDPLDRRR